MPSTRLLLAPQATIVIQMSSSHFHALSVPTKIPASLKTVFQLVLMCQLVTTTMKLVKFLLKFKSSFVLQVTFALPVLSLLTIKVVPQAHMSLALVKPLVAIVHPVTTVSVTLLIQSLALLVTIVEPILLSHPLAQLVPSVPLPSLLSKVNAQLAPRVAIVLSQVLTLQLAFVTLVTIAMLELSSHKRMIALPVAIVNRVHSRVRLAPPVTTTLTPTARPSRTASFACQVNIVMVLQPLPPLVTVSLVTIASLVAE